MSRLVCDGSTSVRKGGWSHDVAGSAESTGDSDITVEELVEPVGLADVFGAVDSLRSPSNGRVRRQLPL